MFFFVCIFKTTKRGEKKRLIWKTEKIIFIIKLSVWNYGWKLFLLFTEAVFV